MLEVLAARRKVRLPPSEDGGAVRRGHRRSADDGGAVGEGVDSLPTMGVEEAVVELLECTANLERRCSRAAACSVMPFRGLVDGFVEGEDVGGLLRADDAMSNPNEGGA